MGLGWDTTPAGHSWPCTRQHPKLTPPPWHQPTQPSWALSVLLLQQRGHRGLRPPTGLVPQSPWTSRVAKPWRPHLLALRCRRKRDFSIRPSEQSDASPSSELTLDFQWKSCWQPAQIPWPAACQVLRDYFYHYLFITFNHLGAGVIVTISWNEFFFFSTSCNGKINATFLNLCFLWELLLFRWVLMMHALLLNLCIHSHHCKHFFLNIKIFWLQIYKI